MDNYQLGLKEDLARNYRGAIEFYSKSVESEELVLDAHINLIVILIIIALDPGLSLFLISKRVYTESELGHLYKYLNRLMQKSLITFNSSEISFWNYYKESFFSNFSRDRISAFIGRDNSNIIPYFQLYIDDLSEGKDVSSYLNQVENLKAELLKKNTIKNDYILALIESAEMHYGGNENVPR